MLTSWLVMAAAMMGQTTQPAAPPADSAPRLRVVTRTTQPASVDDGVSVRVATRPAETAAEQSPVAGGLTGDKIDIQATDRGLVITGSPQDIEFLRQIAEALDRQPQAAFRIFPLKNATAQDIASSVQNLWDKAKAGAGNQVPPQDRLSIIAEPRSNALMVATGEENMAEIEQIIDQLDRPALGPAGQVEFTPIQLLHIKAVEAEQIVKDLLATLQKQRKINQDLFNIKAEIRTNRLLVAAPEADLKQIINLVKLIDVPPALESGGLVKMAIFPLEKAVAQDLADALTEMLQANTDASKVMAEQIRRLRVVLKTRGAEKELPDLDLEKPIKIIPEPGTNSIIVQTVSDNLQAIGEIIHLLDSVPLGDEMMVKMFPLKFADADTLRGNIETMFQQGQKLPEVPGKEKVKGRVPTGAPGAALAYNVGLSADIRTNTLIVSGRAEQVLLVSQVVNAVDVEENANRFPPRLVKLENADVKQIADAVQKLADHRAKMAERLSPTEKEREAILVIADPRTNSLIVMARDDNFNEVADLARKLDGTDDEWLGELRILALTEPLTATDLADKIDALWERRAEQRRQGNLPEDKPVIVPDARTNALVIASTKDDYEAIVKLVQQLQQQPLSPMQDVRSIILKHNEASRIADLVNNVFEQRLKNSIAEGQKEQPAERVFVTGDPMTNLLLVVSSKQNFDEINTLVDKLDMLPAVEGTLRTFLVVNTDVTRAAEMLQTLFDKGIYRGSGPQELPESLKQVTIISDLRSSTLIVSASPENLQIVESLLKDIDREDVPLLQADARFIPIHHADAVNVASKLTEMFDGMKKALGDQGDQLELTAIANARSNVLILAGSRLAMKRAQELVPLLDQPLDQSSYEMKVYKLNYAAAARLEEQLTQLFKERLDTKSAGDQIPVLILSDETTNSLIVSASQDDHQQMRALLDQLDKPSGALQQMAVISLKAAKAQKVADTMQEVVKAQAGSSKGGFAVTAEPRTNSLIVWANPDLMSTIRGIVEQLDNTNPTQHMALRVFRLENAKAQDLADRLDKFFEAAGTGKNEDVRQMIIRFSPVNSETGKPLIDADTGAAVVRSLVHQDVTIEPDPYTNSLLVLAPDESIDMMEMLMQMLDSIQPVTATIQAFQLRNADAEEMRKLLEELFNSQKGGSSQGGQERPTLIFGGGPAAAPTGGAEGTSVELAFTVDQRTNTLVAAGSPSYLRVVEGLVYRLDDQQIDERTVRVVPLQYAKAPDVAQTMTSFFQNEVQLVEKAETGAAATLKLQRQVTIEASAQDSNTNTLLLSYSPRMESQIVTMINELDRPPPQVMIQVLIAEITLDDRFEMGMEFALQDLLFSEKAYRNPNGIVKGNHFDFIGGTDLGAAGSGLGGVSFAVTGEDFNFLVRALQVEGRLEVLSRPSLLVQDNQEATIAVGEQIPVVRDVAVTGTGIATPSIDYKDVGVNLDVTPIINPDGFVNLKIAPEISSLGTSSVSIATGITLPIIAQRKAETSVTVKDGETIIIGGLITSRTNESENKVPVMGDIPLLGIAFRSTVRTQTKTELLMVLTPHVVRTPEDARTISVQMRDQTGLMDETRKSPLMQGLQIKPEEDQLGPVDELKPSGVLPAPSGEEMGPQLEEFGPPTTSIEFGPQRGLIACRSQDAALLIEKGE